MRKRIWWAVPLLAVTLLADVVALQRTQFPRRLRLMTAGTVIELESLASGASASAGTVTVQDMRGFGPGWGGGAQLFWAPPAPIDQPTRNWPHLTLVFTVQTAGTYRLMLAHTVAPDYGRMRIFIGGEPRQDINGWNSTVALRRTEIGQVPLKAGANQMVVTVFGKDQKSANYLVGLDRLELHAGSSTGTPQPSTGLASSAPAPPRDAEEAIVIDLAGSTARFLKPLVDLGSGSCWSANWTFDLPGAPESFFFVGNFDGVPGDELAQRNHATGDWYYFFFDNQARKARREHAGKNDTFGTPGRSDHVAYLMGRHERAGVVRHAPGKPVQVLRYGTDVDSLELLPVGGTGVAIASIDTDGDDRDEVLFYDEQTGALDLLRVTATKPTGDPPRSLPSRVDRVATGLGSGLRFATGDFDGDGGIDLLVHDPKSGEVSIAAFDRRGTLGARRRVATGWPARRWWTRAVDYTGDRRDDLIVHDRVSGVAELIQFSGSSGDTVRSDLLGPLSGPEDGIYPGYFGTPSGPPRTATFLWYEKPGPTDPPGHFLAHMEISENGGKWEAFGLCPTDTPFPPSGAIYVGDFAPDSGAQQPSPTPGTPGGSTPTAAISAADLSDARIDVEAQRSLARMLKEGANGAVASAIVTAIKKDMLAGIYREDQQRPAMRAQKIGKGWWQLFAGQPADRLAFCWNEPADAPPMMVMRRNVKSTPGLDRDLANAWKECGKR